ncbi:sec-independent protein translocase protein TatA [Motilibacter peucedani]|uniref:Sec-independent protein translocase protein TatA n=1 Tax=Motilibacter peucedani TaxID=598650 RepID=A0A420XK67_9ACTN|nr:Sec-independent protein translocase subunit TatA [Motilibacter peucedani]RKS67908.1 sec-independent protein translocase protein TatA [Motilibacter peucedani]
MRNIGAPEIIAILLVVVLLFGAKRLPDTARGLGRSLRIFKAETKGLRDDDKADEETVVTTQQVTPSPRPIESPAPTVTRVTHTTQHSSDVSER